MPTVLQLEAIEALRGVEPSRLLAWLEIYRSLEPDSQQSQAHRHVPQQQLNALAFIKHLPDNHILAYLQSAGQDSHFGQYRLLEVSSWLTSPHSKKAFTPLSMEHHPAPHRHCRRNRAPTEPCTGHLLAPYSYRPPLVDVLAKIPKIPRILPPPVKHSSAATPENPLSENILPFRRSPMHNTILIGALSARITSNSRLAMVGRGI